jgi:chromosome segregation ATPase
VNAQLQEILSESATLKNHIDDDLQVELDDLLSQQQSLDGNNSEARAEVARIKGQIEDKQKEIIALQEERTHCLARIQDKDRLEEDNTRLTDEITKLTVQLEEMKRKLMDSDIKKEMNMLSLHDDYLMTQVSSR